MGRCLVTQIREVIVARVYTADHIGHYMAGNALSAVHKDWTVNLQIHIHCWKGLEP